MRNLLPGSQEWTVRPANLHPTAQCWGERASEEDVKGELGASAGLVGEGEGLHSTCLMLCGEGTAPLCGQMPGAWTDTVAYSNHTTRSCPDFSLIQMPLV